MVLGRAERRSVDGGAGRGARCCSPRACGSRLPDEVLAEIDGDRASSDRERGDDDDGDGGSDGVANDVGVCATGDGATDHHGREPARRERRRPPPVAPRRATAAVSCRGGATDAGVTATEIKVGSIVTASGPLPGATEGLLPRRAGLPRQGERRRRRVRSEDHAPEGRRRPRPAAGSRRVPPARAADPLDGGRLLRGRLGLRGPGPEHRRPLRRHDGRPRGPHGDRVPARTPTAWSHTGPYQYYRNSTRR